MTTNLGGENFAGGKLKETGNSHWFSTTLGTNNETGFTALPGGFRYDDGTFSLPGLTGYWAYWWSSTEINTNNAWYRFIRHNDNYLNRLSTASGVYGLSVRCVKD